MRTVIGEEQFRAVSKELVPAALRSRRDQRRARGIAIQGVEDLFFLALFGLVIGELRRTLNLQVDLIVIRSLQVGPRNGLRARFERSRLVDAVWVAAYRRFCDTLAYRSRDLLSPRAESAIEERAQKIWAQCGTIDQLAALEINNVLIGDLVIDTYLRFKPAVTVDLADDFLRIVLEQALRDLSKANAYFAARQPDIYLTTYTTYIQHGIAVRVAVANGTQVVSFGNLQQVFKLLSAADTRQTKAAEWYARDFAALPEPEVARAAADAALAARINGVIDTATAYMRRSAYAVINDDVPDVEGATIVFLHDFFDSPHIYRWMVFHDFWDWACFTIETLQLAGVKFLVKPHPNQVAGNAEQVRRLAEKFPFLQLVSLEITNKQLVDHGARCAVTVYGTVASEMAYMGLPSICCGDNPHISFDLCRTATSREEYRDLLIKSAGLAADAAHLRREAAAFYHMHNLGGDSVDREACVEFAEIRRSFNKAEGAAALTDQAIERMRSFIETPGFGRLMASIREVIGQRSNG